jgi:hypothetical protein
MDLNQSIAFLYHFKTIYFKISFGENFIGQAKFILCWIFTKKQATPPVQGAWPVFVCIYN